MMLISYNEIILLWIVYCSKPKKNSTLADEKCRENTAVQALSHQSTTRALRLEVSYVRMLIELELFS
jgi:hypothetical protein